MTMTYCYYCQQDTEVTDGDCTICGLSKTSENIMPKPKTMAKGHVVYGDAVQGVDYGELEKRVAADIVANPKLYADILPSLGIGGISDADFEALPEKKDDSKKG